MSDRFPEGTYVRIIKAKDASGYPERMGQTGQVTQDGVTTDRIRWIEFPDKGSGVFWLEELEAATNPLH